MSRRDWHRECLVIARGLMIELQCWTPAHREWGATCQDRMMHTPESWVLSLTPQAAEALHWQLHAERTRQQSLDLDPEIGRITPRIGVEGITRPDLGGEG